MSAGGGEGGRSAGEKGLFKAYLCWLFGGIFGLHHFYLGRDEHAFITFATFGGYFTLGLIRDIWRLPEYVKDANNDREYLSKLHQQIKLYKRPPSSIVRQSGLMMIGNLFAYLIEYAIPKELLHDNMVMVLKFSLVPLGSAFGVWLAGNVGRHEGSIKLPLIASYSAAIISLVLKLHPGSLSTVAAMIAFNRWSKKWSLERPRSKSLVWRICIFTLAILLYLSLWSSWLYFGCTIDDPETHESIKCHEVLNNFVRSPAYTNLSESIYKLFQHIQHQGIIGLWREIMEEIDFSGKNTALTDLGLSDDATPEEILAQYKKLSREYHPDREKDETKKAEKHEKFIQVQEAFRKLEHTVQRYKIQKQREQMSESHDEL